MNRLSRINRRHLIRGGAAATLLAASSLALRAEPVAGGVLRIAAPGGREGPLGLGGVLGRVVGPGSVFDCLTEIGPDGRLHGELAVSWDAHDDATTWVLQLREDVNFHDGRPFTAEDAVASLRRAPVDLGIASLRKTGSLEILIKLLAPDPDFPFALSDPALLMLPADTPNAALAAGNGTGLYRVAGGLRLERVEGHYKDGRAGWFDALELLPIADPVERTKALLACRVDAVAAPDIALIERGIGLTRPVHLSRPSMSQLHIAARGPNARALSQAVKHGLNREALLAAFSGSRLAADHPLDPSAIPPFDPDLAKAILAHAKIDRVTLGFGGGLDGLPGLQQVVRSLKGFARDTGLALAASTDPELLVTLAPAQPTDDLALRRFPRAGLIEPEEFDLRLRKTRIARDSSEKSVIYADFARKIAEEAFTSAPIFAGVSLAHSPRLTHLGHIGALEMLDSGRIAERWNFVDLS